MAEKSQKTLARLPRGFVDRGPDDIRSAEKMMAKIREVYELYGFEPADQPLIEYTDALGKFLPDQDRPNEGVFSFQDDDEQWLSLRYDLTAPMARYVAENYEKLAKPFRSYRSGWVFRNEKPGPGRFRQFMQFDADTVGTPGVAADAEMCMMMADVMEALGIPRGQYVIRVNNRKVLDGVLEAIGLGGDENAGRRLTVLRAIDKLDKFGPEGVALLLGAGRWDGGKEGEGDFTKGAGLDEGQIEPLLKLLTLDQSGTDIDESDDAFIHPFAAIASGAVELGPELASTLDPVFLSADRTRLADYSNGIARLSRLAPVFAESPTFMEGIRELVNIEKLLQAGGYVQSYNVDDRGHSIQRLSPSQDFDRVMIDPSVVRGLEYYTGPVFEAELLAEIPNEDGQIVRFGSVGGGGRYDGLVSRFRGEPVPATGFSIGVSRLLTALKNLGKLDTSGEIGPVVVLVMDRDTESLGKYQRMVSDLRQAGIRAEMYLGGSGMKPQMKYADRRGAPCVVIQGGDERAKGEVQIKDMVVGAELAANIAGHDAYKEARPGQVTVPETELVSTVRRILDAQAADRNSRP
ncbi:MAG: histidine--tRNA ligase family protein [Rhizobiaceae bacterium]|nr:histidine--tRNA ligase family protein [Rhizobiaceae bacterium]